MKVGLWMPSRIPRRIKKALLHPHPPRMRRWTLARRYYLRLGFAIVVVGKTPTVAPFHAIDLRRTGSDAELVWPDRAPT